MRKPSKSSNPRGFKKLNCKFCESVCERVDANATAITCFRCVTKLMRGDVLETKESITKTKTKKKTKK